MKTTEKKNNNRNKTIALDQLRHLGFIPGDVITAGAGDVFAMLFEMNNEDGKQVGFSYLQFRGEATGVILPECFAYYQEYLRKHDVDLAKYRED